MSMIKSFRKLRLGIPMSTRDTRQRMDPPPVPNREEHPYVGTIYFQGIVIYVENKPGSTRSGTDSDGHKWSVKMKHYYGELADTLGADGDPVDCYVGPSPVAPMAFVIHQRQLHGGTEHAPPGTYDEDKVMLGFATKEAAYEAYAAHYGMDVGLPGCSEIPVEELFWMIENEELCYGMPLAKARGYPTGTVRKRKDGYYRKQADGEWKQITEEEALSSGAPKRRTKPAKPKKYEPDPSKSWEDVQPGDRIRVGGRSGDYFYTPDVGEISDPAFTWVTSARSDEPELIRKETMIPLRVKKKVPPPRPKKRTRKPPKEGSVVIGDWEGPVSDRTPKTPEGDVNAPSPRARRLPPWDRSSADPNSYLGRIEQGYYGTRQVVNPRTGRMIRVINVPDADKEGMLLELSRLVAGKVVRKAMRKYRLSHAGSAVREELEAAAHLGLWKALTSYKGARPFEPHAYGYAMAEVAATARSELGMGTPIPDRMMRNLHGYIAAKTRARGKRGTEPTREQIARHWVITKAEVFRSTRKLGNYVDGDAVVDQGREQLPDEDWRIKGPTGEEIGDPHPGKFAMIDTMESLIQGDRVNDSSWMLEHPEALLPGAGGDLSAGAALFLSMEIKQIFDQLDEKHRKVLELLIENGGMRGAGGELTLVDIANELGIKGSTATKNRKAGAVLERARAEFRRLSGDTGTGSAGRAADPWFRAREGRERRPDSDFGPSYEDLLQRFGSAERVRFYHAAVRAGHANRTAKLLEKMRDGTATKAEERRVYEDFLKQRDIDRAREARRQTGHRAIDPKTVGGSSEPSAEQEMEEENRNYVPGSGPVVTPPATPRPPPDPGWTTDVPLIVDSEVEKQNNYVPATRQDGTPITRKAKRMLRDDAGDPVLDEDGKRQYEEYEEQVKRLESVTVRWNGLEVTAKDELSAMSKLHFLRNQMASEDYDRQAPAYGQMGRDAMIIAIKRG